ncbi:ganglioside induced differentiation associated protein [Culex quinquefasciatus]|uniref:Ganglioside induced differentiation associated protein n=1 Tax=Culex quinquefasciatus TaxID=7176 RepID=B0WFM8_CULQU|nr:ganglioside induced differentiation associated protein [Culex quinquefasciatus]|eukprot:XP_001847512.1 ganglioside induced differentiation associated protein [Culex quinquefasciatus]
MNIINNINNNRAMRLVSDIYNESIEPSLGGITKPLTQYVSVEQLTPWGSKEDSSSSSATSRPRTADYHSHIQCGAEGPRHDASPFPWDDQINQRIVIWEGDISLLAVDAITNTTDETLTEKNRVSKKIFGRAGTALTSAVVHDVGRCKTGEVCVTPGFFLPAKYIIHTVGPIYSEKYHTASESTLHSCYRNVLYKAKELGLRTIALCDISSVQRNFPPDTAAHIALSMSISNFIAHNEQSVVFWSNTVPRCDSCLDPNEQRGGIYEVLAPLYFPRDPLEEQSALWQLPKDVGGAYGEPQLADRQIRIIHNPQHAVMIEADDDSDTSPHDLEMGSDVEYNNINLSLASHLGGGTHSFTHMQGDLDRQRLLGDRPRMVYESVVDDGLEGIEHQER